MSVTFTSLELHPTILKAVTAAGYETPTAIQAEAIPLVLQHHDLMAQSSTGSGKTAAFMLPILQKLLTPAQQQNSKGPRALILTPTRELALQVIQVTERYARFMKRLNLVSIVGGVSYHMQLKQLRQPVDVIVATPGRLLDHMERGRIDFSRVETLVLDEADRMLDMGFLEDIEAIMSALPKTRQTLLFSATFEGEINHLAQRFLQQPKRITIATAQTRIEHITQTLHYADNRTHKMNMLSAILNEPTVNQAIVFTATKRDADTLADDLADQGFIAAALHGDMRQNHRTRTIKKLRQGNVRVLVATDVAARGIDVSSISHVVNFDLPRQTEDYVHRIGRTGRAGRAGTAITFATYKERGMVQRIERFTSQKLSEQVIVGLEPQQKPMSERSPKSRKPSRHKKHAHKQSTGHHHHAQKRRDQAGKPARIGFKKGFHPID